MFFETIYDEDCGFSKVGETENILLRLAARGFVVNGNKIGAFYKKNINEYKLPGGGIDEEETPLEAFKREILEETGCEISDIKLIGITNEYKSQTNFVQTSFVYISKLVKQGKVHLTEKEKLEGGEFLWLTLDELLEKVKESSLNYKAEIGTNMYGTKFIITRDTRILEKVKELGIIE